MLGNEFEANLHKEFFFLTRLRIENVIESTSVPFPLRFRHTQQHFILGA